jgi:hypothetical protein
MRSAEAAAFGDASRAGEKIRSSGATGAPVADPSHKAIRPLGFSLILATTVSSIRAVRNAPNVSPRVIRYQQSSRFANGDADRPTPHGLVTDNEAG